jgi:Flp pilus assembly protein TadG
MQAVLEGSLHLFGKFLRDCRGGIAVTTAFAGPVVALVVGAAVEYGNLSARQTKLQNAADAGALMGAAQLRLARTSDQAVSEAAKATVTSMVPAEAGVGPTVAVSIINNRSSVKVSVEETVSSLMGMLVSLPTMQIGAHATANLAGGKSKLCLLTLEPSKDKALNLDKGSSVTASGCTVYSNSTGRHGIQAESGATATAERFCSAGGADVARATVTPRPITDCPKLADPLASLPLPASGGGCLTTDLSVTGNQTLHPGVYCKGLSISGSAVVTLMPGIYTFDNGPLIVTGSATLNGANVGLHFTGNAGGMRLDAGTTIDLTAPRNGTMAGILMSEHRTVYAPVPPPPGPKGSPPPPPYGSAPMREYRITSNKAANLIGTIYLPAGRLIIDAGAPVANKSAYTVIIARQLEIDSGPTVVLNSDYSATDIPVPAGVGPTSGTISLTQ